MILSKKSSGITFKGKDDKIQAFFLTAKSTTFTKFLFVYIIFIIYKFCSRTVLMRFTRRSWCKL